MINTAKPLGTGALSRDEPVAIGDCTVPAWGAGNRGRVEPGPQRLSVRELCRNSEAGQRAISAIRGTQAVRSPTGAASPEQASTPPEAP
jgi:hypothetical protein